MLSTIFVLRKGGTTFGRPCVGIKIEMANLGALWAPKWPLQDHFWCQLVLQWPPRGHFYLQKQNVARYVLLCGAHCHFGCHFGRFRCPKCSKNASSFASYSFLLSFDFWFSLRRQQQYLALRLTPQSRALPFPSPHGGRW